MTAPFYFPMNPKYKQPSYVYITTEQMVRHPEVEAQNEVKRQAINGIKDSLPGYKIRFIYSNGDVVGYKWEKVNQDGDWTDKSWYSEINLLDQWKKLKWNW